ncbi:MAG: glycosyltransferase family 4 protein [Candidatus Rehaiarchaeum fermentans]|nr:glycosyltransferase family 4 protein [Candidatus Rehaiarchaeum fermentans]
MLKKNKNKDEKIAILNYMDILNPKSGGAERYCHEMAKRLAEDGFNVIFLSASFKGSKKEEKYCGYTIRRIGSLKTVYFLGIIELIKIRNLKFIFESINAIPFLFTIFFRKNKIRMIHHIVPFETIREKVHNLLIAKAIYVLQIYITPFLYKRSRIIVNSKSTMLELKELGYKDINIVKSGVEFPQIISYNKEHIILAPGPVKPWKHIDDIITAFSKISSDYKDYKLYIFGNFENLEYEKYCRELVKNLNLDEKIQFLGRISDDDKNKLYSKSFITVLGTEKEGWGLVAMESQSYGTPVIAYDVPGIRDSVINGETGILVPYKNVDALSDAIKLLINDNNLWQKLSKNAIERAKLYNWDESYKDFKSVIEKF